MLLVGRHPRVRRCPGSSRRAGALLVSLKPDEIISLTVPGKLQTYLAAGRPVLGSIDGEAARVIAESGAGFVSAAGDAAGLAENARRLLRMSPDEREALGRAGSRPTAAPTSIGKRCLDSVEAALTRVAASRRRGFIQTYQSMSFA